MKLTRRQALSSAAVLPFAATATPTLAAGARRGKRIADSPRP